MTQVAKYQEMQVLCDKYMALHPDADKYELARLIYSKDKPTYGKNKPKRYSLTTIFTNITNKGKK